MRKRLDFSAISKIILDNRKIGAMSQAEYYFCLFQYAFHQTNIKLTIPEDAEVSKILSGQRNVAKDIIYLYQSSSGVNELKTVLERIFDELSDATYVKEQIYRILWSDNSISQAKKQELSVHYADTSTFVSECLLFALSKNFLPKSRTEAGRKLALSDYLLDTRLPSVTRNFIGREKELKEIAELLQHEHCIFLEGILSMTQWSNRKTSAFAVTIAFSNIWTAELL